MAFSNQLRNMTVDIVLDPQEALVKMSSGTVSLR